MKFLWSTFAVFCWGVVLVLTSLEGSPTKTSVQTKALVPYIKSPNSSMVGRVITTATTDEEIRSDTVV